MHDRTQGGAGAPFDAPGASQVGADSAVPTAGASADAAAAAAAATDSAAAGACAAASASKLPCLAALLLAAPAGRAPLVLAGSLDLRACPRLAHLALWGPLLRPGGAPPCCWNPGFRWR